MVQDWAGQDFPRQDFFPPQHPGWPAHPPNRMCDASGIRRYHPPVEVHEALDSCCGIPAKTFFLAVITPDDEIRTYWNPGHHNHQFDAHAFFDEENFRALSAGRPANNRQLKPKFPPRPLAWAQHPRRNLGDERARFPPEQRQNPDEQQQDDDDVFSMQGRKRHRALLPPEHEDVREVPYTAKVIKNDTLQIGQSEEVREYYESRFTGIQQGACKTLAKAWVKLIEPKKQTAHAYSKGLAAAPAWWPKPWGEGKEDLVRHKEPDHLYKRERVYLLSHILRLIATPAEKQHVDLRKTGVTLAKLEETTMDALTGWFKESKTNEAKRALLLELFAVARQEERYMHDAIDATTTVPITRHGPRKTSSQNSESEDGLQLAETRRPSIATEIACTPPVSIDTNGYPPYAPQGGLSNGLSEHTNVNEIGGTDDMLGYPTTIPQQLPQSQPQYQHFDGISLSGPLHLAGSAPLAMNMVPPAQGDHRRNSMFQNFSPASTTNGLYSQPHWSSVSSAAGSPASFPYRAHAASADTPMYLESPLASAVSHPPSYVHSFEGAIPASDSGFQHPKYGSKGDEHEVSL